MERTRTDTKCPKMKNTGAKRAKLLFFFVKYVKLLPSSSWLLKFPIISSFTLYSLATLENLSDPNHGGRCLNNVTKERTGAEEIGNLCGETRRDPNHLLANQALARHRSRQQKIPNTTVTSTIKVCHLG